MPFSQLKVAMQRQFLTMRTGPLFRVAVDKHALWDKYLSSYPPGSNPKFREKTEHDCSCCRHFIYDAGAIVGIDSNNKLISIWDLKVDDPAFQAVADAMSAFVKSHEIENAYAHYAGSVGTDSNFDDKVAGKVIKWEHFFLTLPQSCVVRSDLIGKTLSDARADHDVLLRSLKELSLDAVDTVLELIAQNSIYRGAENKYALTEFRKLKVAFAKVAETEQSIFCWARAATANGAVTRIRNSSIGTLLEDLTKKTDLEEAVKSFEAKVAPANYKRPTQLVTQSMIDAAKKKIEELGLTSALERRYATLRDLSVEFLLFVDRSAREALGGSVFDDIRPTRGKEKKFSKVEEIGIEAFLTDVLPYATSLEVMVENKHTPNLVSLIAPSDLTAKGLFKWPNNFSWSYAGDFADASIKERVKKAGGKVDGDLRCSLSWYNSDDLDLHMIEPDENEIFFASKLSPSGGNLDVDMNAYGPESRTPVENICFPNRTRMREGVYKLFVNNYIKREMIDVGFEVEVEFDGVTHSFPYQRDVKQGENVMVAEISYTKKDGFKIVKSLPSTQTTKEVWGISTQTFVPVTVVMLSPNYWGGEGVGPKHYFFMLQGCRNDGAARGFYNENLRNDLNQHRKVLEVVGSKVRAAASEDQLSGLGFSSTQRNRIIVKVVGSFTRTMAVVF